MSKYCELYFDGCIFGFPNQQVRAKAYALQPQAISQKMTAVSFKSLLHNNGITSTDPMVESLNAKQQRIPARLIF